jgi:hypothetical protein
MAKRDNVKQKEVGEKGNTN